MGRLGNWFKALSVGGKTGLILAVFIGISVVGAASHSPSNNSNIAKPLASTSPSKTAIVTKSVTTTKSIPFTTSTVHNGSLAQGTTNITTQGVNGVETLIYQDTYTSDKQTDHKLISDVITTKPVTQVTSVGTYVAPSPQASAPTNCTNGTYVNSVGNTICSPETSTTVPSGATAQCVDGTYSFSQHHSGTCSYHGGVAQWLS